MFLTFILILTILAYASIRWGADTTDDIQAPEWQHHSAFGPRAELPNGAC